VVEAKLGRQLEAVEAQVAEAHRNLKDKEVTMAHRMKEQRRRQLFALERSEGHIDEGCLRSIWQSWNLAVSLGKAERKCKDIFCASSSNFMVAADQKVLSKVCWAWHSACLEERRLRDLQALANVHLEELERRQRSMEEEHRFQQMLSHSRSVKALMKHFCSSSQGLLSNCFGSWGTLAAMEKQRRAKREEQYLVVLRLIIAREEGWIGWFFMEWRRSLCQEKNETTTSSLEKVTEDLESTSRKLAELQQAADSMKDQLQEVKAQEKLDAQRLQHSRMAAFARHFTRNTTALLGAAFQFWAQLKVRMKNAEQEKAKATAFAARTIAHNDEVLLATCLTAWLQIAAQLKQEKHFSDLEKKLSSLEAAKQATQERQRLQNIAAVERSFASISQSSVSLCYHAWRRLCQEAYSKSSVKANNLAFGEHLAGATMRAIKTECLQAWHSTAVDAKEKLKLSHAAARCNDVKKMLLVRARTASERYGERLDRLGVAQCLAAWRLSTYATLQVLSENLRRTTSETRARCYMIKLRKFLLELRVLFWWRMVAEPVPKEPPDFRDDPPIITKAPPIRPASAQTYRQKAIALPPTMQSTANISVRSSVRPLSAGARSQVAHVRLEDLTSPVGSPRDPPKTEQIFTVYSYEPRTTSVSAVQLDTAGPLTSISHGQLEGTSPVNDTPASDYATAATVAVVSPREPCTVEIAPAIGIQEDLARNAAVSESSYRRLYETNRDAIRQRTEPSSTRWGLWSR